MHGSMADPDSHPLFIRGLLSPDAYPHPVVPPVRLVETHVSWVLLTGPFAYKLKKPLKLGFLDYSTPEKRRVFCEEELRLNSRYAADLYLDVATITGTPEAPSINGDQGGRLDFAVRMRQFDTSEELDVLLDSKSVEATDLTELGRRLAHFHESAARVDEDQPFGLADRVHQVTTDNFMELRAAAPGEPLRGGLEQLREHVDELFASSREAMIERRRQGCVRECHGDLHCANVVRWKGLLTPFDGIEFDPALRFIDVANDLAFLTMDLSAHGRADLRHAVLQAWVETLGDFDGLALLPYFECYRALVRAKVSALRAAQEPAGSAEHDAARAAIRHYLSWAEAGMNRFPPQLIITAGVSGSGKTWLARQIAERMPAVHVRSDIERKRIAGLDPLADSRSAPGGGIYRQEINEQTYQRLYGAAASGLSVPSTE